MTALRSWTSLALTAGLLVLSGCSVSPTTIGATVSPHDTIAATIKVRTALPCSDVKVPSGTVAVSGSGQTPGEAWCTAKIKNLSIADASALIDVVRTLYVPMDAAATKGTLSIVRDGSQYVVTGWLSLHQTSCNSALVCGPVVDLSLTFPGPVASTDGTVSGTSVSWHASSMTSVATLINAQASAVSEFPTVPLVMAIGVLVMACAGVIAWRVTRRRQQDASAALEPSPHQVVQGAQDVGGE